MTATTDDIVRDPRVRAEVCTHPYPLLFATVSGAHLYGFPSPDSDVDLRGVHVTPMPLLTGLARVEETVSVSHVRDGLEVDLVTHEVRKSMALLLRNNGYVLEQLYSPLVVHTTPAHAALKSAARGCITRACVRHYLGFAANQWALYGTASPRRVKPLLYVFRVLLTGIHLMGTGEVEANLVRCNEARGAGRLAWLDELVARKREGAEQETLASADVAFHAAEYDRLRAELAKAAQRSTLPEAPTAAPALEVLLHDIRTTSLAA